MWQRIQTLYLAIATILLGSLFFVKFATIIGPMGDTAKIFYHEKLPYLLFTIIVTAVNLFALMMFKIRMFQMRVCIFAAIILIGFQIWLGVDVIRNFRQMAFSFTAIFPIVAAILDALAARAILIDESIVRSASRLRSARGRKK
ncbi:MAG: DUF4293 domain-containing protein [Bacteroidales bacterium]|nr:DUF4293 domain-containing protein [Bacteroidales bacterium]